MSSSRAPQQPQDGATPRPSFPPREERSSFLYDRKFPPQDEMPSFFTETEAHAWLKKTLNDENEYCLDNRRFTFLDDHVALQAYEEKRENHCCGRRDRAVLVDGRPALVGCNYGH